MATVSSHISFDQLHETTAVEAVVADDVLDGAVDGEPVFDDGTDQDRSVVPSLGAALAPVAAPVVQAVAAAATGFVAGAATLAIARRASARRVSRTATRRRADALPVLGTRSFLIDIHMLRPGE
jgi:subtilisin family serine protease